MNSGGILGTQYLIGKQKYACKDCNRRFVLEPENCIFKKKRFN
jgi:transposase-like protein